MQISSLFRRFWAYYFDCNIILGIYGGLIFGLKVYGMNIQLFINKGVDFNYDIILKILMFYGLFFFIYEYFFVVIPLSATPGKLLFDLEVAFLRRGNIFKVFLRSILKTLATLIPFGSFIFCLAALFTSNKQSIHDAISGTIVIKKAIKNKTKTFEDVDIFQEMKERGIKTYSEQLELMKELKGEAHKSSPSYKWVGILFISISILGMGAFVYSILEDFIL